MGDERLEADQVVWAGGAWLAGLFPELVDLRVTRQDVYFFGAPTGWQAPDVPAWVDFDNGVYGVGDLDGRGFKASPDREGPDFDPDSGERVASQEKETEARGYLALRFPALAGAPLVGTRSCPYSLTEDTNFLIAPHPEQDAGLAARRRLGPRLQARPRPGGVRGAAAERGREARSGVRARRSRPRGRFARPLDRAVTDLLDVKLPFIAAACGSHRRCTCPSSA